VRRSRSRTPPPALRLFGKLPRKLQVGAAGLRHTSPHVFEPPPDPDS
jgi:hypothetical protein